ncbi:MAG: hypothetical protein A2937_03545 [Candidatus Yonathbacteria bacterium RIFCSPLOWO2_01_FULL_47_33b]|uniref:Lipoprotein n=1 Tax=Candidatus Yonathbacteria bacterium RIFCSPLOWO2_01_FULL_47_33b TaxID=1802727 RepID=A0A1G2SE84_9BACT|nr:MAG: hypothetical protein A2937_03545 [Candidatus Yonathbacteria bacterium RIFCSPLOWO2_01_FULL_47_33b]
MVQKIRYSIYLIVAVLVFGCGAISHPSEGDAKREFVQRDPFDLMNKSLLKSFKKVNGQTGETFGVKWYKIDYEAEVVYAQDVPRRMGCAEFIEGDCGGHRAGEKKIVKGDITFEQTEKGWKGPTGTVY